MAEQQDMSIHAKKYYRVVLSSIDKEKESVESFAIKMTMRLRTPFPRVMHILRHLPCTIKSGLSVSQANRLYNVMEDLGARVSIETYFLTPGEQAGRAHRGDISISTSGLRKKKLLKCPACGWENDEVAEFCSLCLGGFKKKDKRDPVPQTPEENPLIDQSASDVGLLKSIAAGISEKRLMIGLVLLAILVLAILKK